MGYKDLCIIKCRVFIFNPGRKYPPCKMIPGFMTFLVMQPELSIATRLDY